MWLIYLLTALIAVTRCNVRGAVLGPGWSRSAIVMTTSTGQISVKPELGVAVAQNAAVQEALTATEAKQADAIIKFCKVLIASATKQAQVYYDLVTYIRNNKVSPKLVSDQMRGQGFNKARISEVNRVANAPEELYNAFAAKALGFKNVLQLVRGSDATTAEVTPAGKALLGDKISAAGVLEAEAAADETMGVGKIDREARSVADRVDEAAAKLLDLLEKSDKRFPWRAKNANGLVLTVFRAKPLTKKTAGSARLANLGPVAGRPSALKMEAEESK